MMTTLTASYNKRELAALAAKRDFTAFKLLAWRRYEHAPHLALIDRALMEVERYIRTGEGIRFLLIELPPRHGKSQTVARLFPAWFLGRNPNMRVILASYGASLSEKHSRFVRAVLQMKRYHDVFPGIELSPDSRAKDAWDLAAPYEGGMDAIGKDGPATGKGANLLITDDLIKSRAEAESANMREKDWEWLQDDLLTRLEPNGAHIAIGTRWHSDDVHGRIILNEADLWHRIRLPALAEENDLLGRKVGQALWPERFPVDEIELKRRRMADYSFSAEYQQAPVPSSGGLFKRDKFNVIDHEPADIVRRVRFWDLALSGKTSADYTVGVLMGETERGRTIILDVARFQVEWDDVTDAIANVAHQDGSDVGVGVETAFYQTRAVTKLLQRGDMHAYNVWGFDPDKDKFTRALPFAARVGAGMVDVLRRSWTEALLDELCSFPLGAHDDQVDACSGAYVMLDDNPLILPGGMTYAEQESFGTY